MFPTPPELREELHEIGQHQAHVSESAMQAQAAHSKSQATGEQCLCGCAQRPDNSKKILKIKIVASLLLLISISLVGLNAYQRDAAQASNAKQPQSVVFQNPAGAIQAAETTFPTMTPLNDTQPQACQQMAMPMQMTAQMATPMSVPVNYDPYYIQAQQAQQAQMQQQMMYQHHYNPYPTVANYPQQQPMMHCTNEVRQDLVGQRLKRFVTR